ncbi:MAG: hypothetical protein AAF409_08460 [Pseudomonadota bacterium]
MKTATIIVSLCCALTAGMATAENPVGEHQEKWNSLRDKGAAEAAAKREAEERQAAEEQPAQTQ